LDRRKRTGTQRLLRRSDNLALTNVIASQGVPGSFAIAAGHAERIADVKNDQYLVAGWCFIGMGCAAFLIGVLSSI
jgi:hypothetical protein